MYLSDSSLDDLLRRVLQKLVTRERSIKPTRGAATEYTGVLLQLSNPRARLSRTEKKGKFFSALGELLWYLAGSNSLSFIQYYVPQYKDNSDDGSTIYGAYGPRLFSMPRGGKKINQIDCILRLLKSKPESRRAVIQLFDAGDIVNDTRPGFRHKDVPCTCTLQFTVRNKRLNLMACMRSNDAYIGLPHDIFCFTMLQEIIARTLDLELGRYKHFAGSLHLYETNLDDAKQYIDEGFQPKSLMPAMPFGDPWPAIKQILKIERAIRCDGYVNTASKKLPAYWADLGNLLNIYRASRLGDSKRISRLKRLITSREFDPYIEQRKRLAMRKPVKAPEQMALDLGLNQER